jgi:hypothetical protein
MEKHWLEFVSKLSSANRIATRDLGDNNILESNIYVREC